MSLNGLQPGEPTSFVRRFLHWLDVLDPTTLLASDEEIKNSKALLQSVGHITKDAIQNRKVEDAGKLCEVSLHPDTGNIIPTLFRPPAFMPLATPLAIVTFLQHTGTKPAFFWQLLFQSYSAGFNLVNGNKTWKAEKMEPKQCLLFAVSVSYTACIAVTPQFLMNRFKLTSPIMQTFFRRVLPAPLLSLLGAINVGIVRAPEIEHGIEVVDKAGNVVGVSQRAGEKAVRETAMSRAALIGVTALIPAVLQRFLQSSHFVLRNPRALAPIKHISAVFVFGAMIPVSFSLFPQHGKILRADLEAEVQASTTESELFYHRGL